MSKPVTVKEVRDALMVLYKAYHQGDYVSPSMDHIPDLLSDVAQAFGPVMDAAHMSDIYSFTDNTPYPTPAEDMFNIMRMNDPVYSMDKFRIMRKQHLESVGVKHHIFN
jgi:hypothetical protein